MFLSRTYAVFHIVCVFCMCVCVYVCTWNLYLLWNIVLYYASFNISWSISWRFFTWPFLVTFHYHFSLINSRILRNFSFMYQWCLFAHLRDLNLEDWNFDFEEKQKWIQRRVTCQLKHKVDEVFLYLDQNIKYRDGWDSVIDGIQKEGPIPGCLIDM